MPPPAGKLNSKRDGCVVVVVKFSVLSIETLKFELTCIRGYMQLPPPLLPQTVMSKFPSPLISSRYYSQLTEEEINGNATLIRRYCVCQFI
jgi:hypothetical protein